MVVLIKAKYPAPAEFIEFGIITLPLLYFTLNKKISPTFCYTLLFYIESKNIESAFIPKQCLFAKIQSFLSVDSKLMFFFLELFHDILESTLFTVVAFTTFSLSFRFSSPTFNALDLGCFLILCSNNFIH